MRQVGYLAELHEDARSEKYKNNYSIRVWCCVTEVQQLVYISNFGKYQQNNAVYVTGHKNTPVLTYAYRYRVTALTSLCRSLRLVEGPGIDPWSLGIFSGASDSSMCSGVDSASKNEYQDIPGGKDGRRVRVTTFMSRVSRNSVALTYQKPQRPLGL